jgi:hypothetical protein
MKPCKCGSYAINHASHGRDGSDGDLCDVCYWRKRAEPREPMTDEQLIEARKKSYNVRDSEPWADTLSYGRAIEAFHGIKEKSE